MRADMSRVIVERPRRGGLFRRGRSLPIEEMPLKQGMRRPYKIGQNWKQLNENLAPLRRYLERQVGRPWDKVYSEIAAHLRTDNTVQQHVREHLRDFVAVTPRRLYGTVYGYPEWTKTHYSQLWHQPFYVDERDGILKRTDRLPEEKARRRADRSRTRLPQHADRVRLDDNRELRQIDGLWYELRLAVMPDPVYRSFVETRKMPLSPWRRNGRSVEIQLAVRRLVISPVRDAATGQLIEVGPRIDEPGAWNEYRKSNPDRRYTVVKRRLCKTELRRNGLQDHHSDPS